MSRMLRWLTSDQASTLKLADLLTVTETALCYTVFAHRSGPEGRQLSREEAIDKIACEILDPELLAQEVARRLVEAFERHNGTISELTEVIP